MDEYALVHLIAVLQEGSDERLVTENTGPTLSSECPYVAAVAFFSADPCREDMSKRVCREVRQQNREVPFLVPVHAFFLSQPLFDWLCRCLESDPGHTQPTNTDITVFRR